MASSSSAVKVVLFRAAMVGTGWSSVQEMQHTWRETSFRSVYPIVARKNGAVVKRCILAENVVVGAGAKIGGDGPIAHIGTGLTIGAGAAVKEGAKVFDSVKEGEEVC